MASHGRVEVAFDDGGASLHVTAEGAVEGCACCVKPNGVCSQPVAIGRIVEEERLAFEFQTEDALHAHLPAIEVGGSGKQRYEWNRLSCFIPFPKAVLRPRRRELGERQ